METGSRERIATVQVGVPSLLCIEAQWRARLNYVDSLFVKRCGGVATHEKFCDSGASCVTFEVSNIRSFAFIKYLAMHISPAFAA